MSVTEYSSNQPIREEWTERERSMPRPLACYTLATRANSELKFRLVYR